MLCIRLRVQHSIRTACDAPSEQILHFQGGLLQREGTKTYAHRPQDPSPLFGTPIMHGCMFNRCCQWLSGCEDCSQQHDQDMSHGQSHDQSSQCNNVDQIDTSPDEGCCPIVFGLESEEEERPEGAEPQMAENTCFPEHADVDMMSGEQLHLYKKWFYTCYSPCVYMWWAWLFCLSCQVVCAMCAVLGGVLCMLCRACCGILVGVGRVCPDPISLPFARIAMQQSCASCHQK